MSLEITILNVDGFPQEILCLDVDLHFLLMQSIKAKPDSILMRIEDYYSDALFNVDELDEVNMELTRLIAEHSTDLKQIEFLNAFKNIVVIAQERKTPLEVLAD